MNFPAPSMTNMPPPQGQMNPQTQGFVPGQNFAPMFMPGQPMGMPMPQPAMPQPTMPQPNANLYGQNTAYPNPQVQQPKVEKKPEKPKDFASMMQQFEQASLDKKDEVEREKMEQEQDEYGDEYDNMYGDETGHQQPGGLGPMGSAQNLLNSL